MGADRAGVQQERVVDLVAFQDTGALAGFGVGSGGARVVGQVVAEEFRVRCGIDQAGAVGDGGAEVDGVALSGFGDADDAVGTLDAAFEAEAAGLVEEAFGVVVIEAGEVVDGDDVGLLDEQRDAVEGDVGDVGGDAVEQAREIEVIPARGVSPGVFMNTKVRGEPDEVLAVVGVSDKFVLVLGRGFGQRLKQVANVRADTEIAYAAGVDGDAH